MIREHTKLHYAAGICGQAAIFTDAGSNVEFMYNQTGTLLDTNILVVVVIAVCNSIALAAAIKAFQQGDRIVTAALALGFVCASVFSLSATYHRVTSTNTQSAQNYLMKDREYKSLSILYDVALTKSGQYCDAETGKTKAACIKREKTAAALRDRRDRRADQINVKIPGLSAEVTSMLPNLTAPLALYIFANCLLAFGINGRLVRPEFETTAPDKPIDKARRFVVNYIETNGCKPSVSLIVERVGVTAYYARKALT